MIDMNMPEAPCGAPMVQTPTVGRIVLVRLPAEGLIKASAHGAARPALVTAVVSPTQVNVQVFLDGPNDAVGWHVSGPPLWLGTVDFAPAEFNVPRSWHWPPRVGG